MAGRRSLGDLFQVFKGADGLCRVTTYTVTNREDAMGALAQEFTVDDSTKALRFQVHGGEATVRLHKDFEVLPETRGRSGHDAVNTDTEVCWNLSEYAGDVLTVAIFDRKKGDWGFIGATGFEFLKPLVRLIRSRLPGFEHYGFLILWRSLTFVEVMTQS